MNRPEGIGPEAWEAAADPAKRILAGEDFATIEAFGRVLFAAQCTISRAIQSSVEAERERIAKEVARVVDTLPTEGTVAQTLRTATAIDRIFAAIRKGA